MFCGFLIYLFAAECKVPRCVGSARTVRSLSRLLERRRSEALYSAARDNRIAIKTTTINIAEL